MRSVIAAQQLQSIVGSRFIQRNASLLLSYFILLVMALFYVVYAARQGQLSSYSVTSILNNTTPLLFAAVGQTFVVLTRGVDLSTGAVVSLANSLAAVLIHDSAASMIGWSIFILAVGGAVGAINGVLVSVGRIQPILATLATLSIWTGVAQFVLPEPGGVVPEAYTNLLTGSLFDTVPSSLIVLALLILFWNVFRQTGLSVAIYALGNDERSAFANGVNVRLTKVLAYALSSAFAAMAGLYLSALTTSGDTNIGAIYTLTSIAAVVLGGVSLFGGRGSALGSMAGAFVLTLSVNILFLARINPWLQEFFQGLVLILAMAAHTLLSTFSNRIQTASGDDDD
jgi:ribose transport system permease protein